MMPHRSAIQSFHRLNRHILALAVSLIPLAYNSGSSPLAAQDSQTAFLDSDIVEFEVHDLIRRPLPTSEPSPVRLRAYFSWLNTNGFTAGVSDPFDFRIPTTQTEVELEDGPRTLFMHEPLERGGKLLLTGFQINRAYRQCQSAMNEENPTPGMYIELFQANDTFDFSDMDYSPTGEWHFHLSHNELRQLADNLRQGYITKLELEDDYYRREQELEKGHRVDGYPDPDLWLKVRLVDWSEFQRLATRVDELERENRELQQRLDEAVQLNRTTTSEPSAEGATAEPGATAEQGDAVEPESSTPSLPDDGSVSNRGNGLLRTTTVTYRGGMGNPQQDRQDQQEETSEEQEVDELSDDVIAAWRGAGATPGYLVGGRLSPFGGMDFREDSAEIDEPIPAFRLDQFDAVTLSKLVTPQVPFGLTLAGSSLRDVDLSLLRRFENLVALDLSNAEATGAHVMQIQELDHLTALSLNLGFTNIGDREAKPLAKLEKLTFLDLGNTVVSKATCETVLNQLAELRVLRLSGTQVSNEGLASLAKLEHLRSLDLSSLSDGFDGACFQSLKSFPALVELNLSASSVGANGLKGIEELSRLERLDLSFTQTDDKAADRLARLQQLRELNLTGCPIGEESRSALQKALSDCKITF